MRKAILVAALALAACKPAADGNAVAAGGGQSGDVSQADMKAAFDDLQKAFASGDSLAIMEHYAPGAVLLDAGHVRPTADRQLQTQWTAQFATMHPSDFVTSDLSLQPLGPDAFVATGLQSFTALVGPGRDVLHVRFNQAFRRQPDGKWMVVAEHVSMPPPEATP